MPLVESGRGSERPLRIIHCLRAPVGGLFRHVRDLAAEQAARGHAVGVICDASAADDLTQQRLATLSQHLSLGMLRMPMSRDLGPSDIGAYRAARRFAVEKRADIFHGHGAKGGAYARLAARSIRRHGGQIACLYTPHGGSLHYAPTSLRGRIYMTLERQLASATQGIIFESAYARRAYEAQVGAPACRVAVITNGLHDSDFDAVTPLPDAADFLFVGELRLLKGVDVLIDALGCLSGAPAPTAVLVGQGPDLSRFKAQIADRGLSDRITLLGALPVKDAFRRGRCMIVPSRAESLPYIVLESAAAGMPLIATQVGGIPEIVAGTDTRLLAAGDVGALADAMRGFLAEPAAAQARAIRLRDVTRDRFSLPAMADGVLKLYRQCLA